MKIIIIVGSLIVTILESLLIFVANLRGFATMTAIYLYLFVNVLLLLVEGIVLAKVSRKVSNTAMLFVGIFTALSTTIFLIMVLFSFYFLSR